MNINKVNNKLKYEKYCDYTNDDWSNYKTYSNIPIELANSYDFIDTFKDKIHFDLFYKYRAISHELIKLFIELYDEATWKTLSLYYHSMFSIKFINQYYEKISYPICDIQLNTTLLKSEAKQKLDLLYKNKIDIDISIAMEKQNTTPAQILKILGSKNEKH